MDFISSGYLIIAHFLIRKRLLPKNCRSTFSRAPALYKIDTLEETNLEALGLSEEDKTKRRLLLWIFINKIVELDKKVTLRLVHA